MRTRGRIKLRKSILLLLLQYLRIFAPVLALYLVLSLLVQALSLDETVVVEMLRGSYYAAGAVLLLEMIRRYFDELYVLGRRRVGYLSGLASFRLKKISIQYRDIREVQMNQSIVGRMLGYGDVLLGTAATNDYEIIFVGVPFPQQVVKFIEEKLHRPGRRESSESPEVVDRFAALHVSLSR